MRYLGLDVGTQGSKALVIDREAGRVIARASASYDLMPGLAAGAAEQEPATWLSAIESITRELAESVDLASCAAIGVSGQQHGFVPLDDRFEVLRPAKLWCDTSTASEARVLSERFGRSVPTGFTASKILWLREHEAQNWERLRHVALPHDYINWALTGELVMECGDASGTGFFDPVARDFDSGEVELLDPRLGEMLPRLIGAGDPAGRVHAAAAKRFGLREGALVSSGGGDNMMSAIGSGAIEPGVVVTSLGTSGTVFAYADEPVVDSEGLIAGFCDSTGAWLPLLCVMNLTGTTEEVRKSFGLDHGTITDLARRVDVGSDGLLCLPFFQGERVPDLPEASASLLGMHPGWLDPGRLYRAMLEGTSLNLAWGIDKMKALGVRVDSLRLVGGAARNPLWRRILADVFVVPVQLMAEAESAALGAALQAAWTHARSEGSDESLAELCDRFVGFEEQAVEPSADGVVAYAALRDEWTAELRARHGVS